MNEEITKEIKNRKEEKFEEIEKEFEKKKDNEIEKG